QRAGNAMLLTDVVDGFSHGTVIRKRDKMIKGGNMVVHSGRILTQAHCSFTLRESGSSAAPMEYDSPNEPFVVNFCSAGSCPACCLYATPCRTAHGEHTAPFLSRITTRNSAPHRVSVLAPCSHRPQQWRRRSTLEHSRQPPLAAGFRRQQGNRVGFVQPDGRRLYVRWPTAALWPGHVHHAHLQR